MEGQSEVAVIITVTTTSVVATEVEAITTMTESLEEAAAIITHITVVAGITTLSMEATVAEVTIAITVVVGVEAITMWVMSERHTSIEVGVGTKMAVLLQVVDTKDNRSF